MDAKVTAKRWIKTVAVKSRALALAVRFSEPAAVILMYHSVQVRPEEYADSVGLGITHAASVFERHMQVVARRFSPVTLDDVLLFLQGKRRLPRRAVAVTFDDGYADNHTIAAPILERLGIRGAFYVTVNLIATNEAPWFCRLRHAFATTREPKWFDGRDDRNLASQQARNAALLAAFDLCSPLPDDQRRKTIEGIEADLRVAPLRLDRLMMDWDQARSLAKAGHIVGSHTLTHPNVAHVRDEAVVRAEIVDSKRKLEEQLGTVAPHFSYPHPALNPQWSEETLAVTRQAGYCTAVLTTGGPVRGGHDPLLLARIRTPNNEPEFLWNLECAFLGRRV